MPAQTAVLLPSFAPHPSPAPREYEREGLTPSELAAGQAKRGLLLPCRAQDGTGFRPQMAARGRGKGSSTPPQLPSSLAQPHFPIPAQPAYECESLTPFAQFIATLASGRGKRALLLPRPLQDSTAFRQLLDSWVRNQAMPAQTAVLLPSFAPHPNPASDAYEREGLTPSELAAGQGKGVLLLPHQLPDGTGFRPQMAVRGRGKGSSTPPQFLFSLSQPHFPIPAQPAYECESLASLAQSIATLAARQAKRALLPLRPLQDSTAFRQLLDSWVRN